MIAAFYLSLLLLLYIFLGYPFLMAVLARSKHGIVKKEEEHIPFVSILLSVHNEGKKVRQRIEGLLNIEYPADKIELLIGSDGSSDATNDIIRDVKEKKVHYCIFSEHRGKASVLNDLAAKAAGEILIFADCRQRWDKYSLITLVKNFVDEKVGVVSGQIDEGREGYYRKYENFIRIQESKFNSTPGAYGPFYGVRKKLFKVIPEDTILDDFVIPMEAVKQGYRSILEPLAVAHDITFSLEQERIKKERTIAGNFQVFFRYGWLLDPFRNPIWFQTFSHKFLRLMAPFFFITLFVSNVFLWGKDNFFKSIFLLQLIFYVLGFMGMIRFSVPGQKDAKNGIERVLLLFGTFVELNWATVRGLWRYLTGDVSVKWKRYDENNISDGKNTL